ncbi:fumarylacetoacetate hydrolase family protein [Streptomyces sp. Li-HN-5-11]|uniref:fumarylacetoacetate hydrolase family protein n=1 Tax=Streptomyces sp. Li-HN-5-11 TaxID=3075432 RepID=UPI0028A83EA0|nr:fumarylacetoacetate hydrolase family protein [Streptomyces sp. Li-HN-5-11]WNM31664.1 fumarylacetoacetate hydrolase family protein [Streptomyces sp. Li-HN-5-11]
MKSAAAPPQFSGPFALGTFSAEGTTAFPGLVVPEGRALDLVSALGEPGLTTRSILERWDTLLPRLHGLARDTTHGWLPLEGLRVHAPVEPRQIFQSGANYRTHVIELAVAHEPEDGRPAEQVRAEIASMMDRRAAEGEPFALIGLPSSITGPYDDVVLPSWCEKPDWELELAAVIGAPAFRVTPDEALSHVAAYTIANDLTARDLVFRRDMPEIGTDWLRGKSAPGFTPLGPWLVPAAFAGDPSGLQVTLRLNGQVMQDDSTKDMIFDVARLVSYVSQVTTLLPGDLVLTGSPAGNGLHWGRLLRDGDVMEGCISGLGVQRNRCVAEVTR